MTDILHILFSSGLFKEESTPRLCKDVLDSTLMKRYITSMILHDTATCIYLFMFVYA